MKRTFKAIRFMFSAGGVFLFLLGILAVAGELQELPNIVTLITFIAAALIADWIERIADDDRN